MTKWRQYLGALLLGIFLVACGGGDQSVGPLGDLNVATASDTTIDGRARALASTREQALAVTPTITPVEFFAYAEALLPTTFPSKGSTSGTIDYLGVIYTYRGYTTGYYLGVTLYGGVYMLAPDGKLYSYGKLPDYACKVKPVACGAPVTIAGKIKVDVATHTVTPALVEGKITGLSTGSLDPTLVAKICAESLVLGFDGNTKACAPLLNGQAVIKGVTNNDRVQYTIRTTGGQYVWLGLDPSESTYWQCEGLGCKYAGPANPGFVEYSEGGVGYRKPRISVASGKLILSFGRNQLAGFGLDGVPTDFFGEHFQFVFRSTANKPTVAYRTWNDTTKEYQVVFTGLAKCTDTGNVTVHRQVIGSPPDQVFYSETAAGWLSVATPPNQPDLIWGFDPGVTPVVNPPFVGFTYKLPGC